jgi:hypothetical protein
VFAAERERARLEERARRHAERVEERAAAQRCRVCAYQCLDAFGARCLYCGNHQNRTGSPMPVEHRATDHPPVTNGVSERAAYYGMRVEHSRHIGRIMDVR